jgi:hypothetical protein
MVGESVGEMDLSLPDDGDCLEMDIMVDDFL